MASFENTGANASYSGGRITLGLDFSAAAANSVAVVSLAMIGEWFGINRFPQRRIRKIAWLFKARSRNWFSDSCPR